MSESGYLARRQIRLIVGAMSEHRPGNAGGLVGQGHRGHIGVTSAHQIRDPLAQSVVFALGGLP